MAKKGASPTVNTLKRLREAGYMAAVVEHWNAHRRIRQDLFGFVDIVAVHATHKRILLVQTTSKANISTRVRKITGECSAQALACVDAGAAIEVWGWAKEKNRWQATVKPIERMDIVSGPAIQSRKSKRKAAKQVKQQTLELEVAE